MARFLTVLVFVCAVPLFSQDASPPGPPGGGRGRGMGAMPAPKNLKILKPEEIRPVMSAFVAGTGLKCGDCHVIGAFDSDEKPRKVTARRMLEMVRGVNATTFNGNDKVTCYTCHRGEARPVSAPPAQ
ncbi:MAG TPA: photosynthetic reaction center cytochrome c subunit family protein [Bryobacteraceae bacterium]|nr:photosynthetic reaction center cytochrome c subunit family protein [Bryobacteraceae bacterium]